MKSEISKVFQTAKRRKNFIWTGNHVQIFYLYNCSDQLWEKNVILIKKTYLPRFVWNRKYSLSRLCSRKTFNIINLKQKLEGFHTAWMGIWMTKRRDSTSDNAFTFKKINENKKRSKNPASRFGNNPICPLLSTWISIWTEPYK